MSEKDATRRARLNRLMDVRRTDLRLRWRDVAERAGLTTEGLRTLRSGTGSIRELSKRGIEDALEWEHGSVDLILAGGDPVPARPAEKKPAEQRSPVELQRELMERIKRINEVPDRRDMLDKFTKSIDPGESQAG